MVVMVARQAISASETIRASHQVCGPHTTFAGQSPIWLEFEDPADEETERRG